MEERIRALIIQYDDLFRYRKKLLECNLAEALLSIIPISVKNQDELEAHINEKIEECKRIKKRLKTARCKVSKLYAKYKENTQVKEFLDFAIFRSSVGDSNEVITSSNSENRDLLQSHNTSLKDYLTNEIINDDKLELESMNLLNEEETLDDDDVFTLISKLNAEKFQREYFESERDKLDYLADKLCCLLHQYERRVRLLEKNETSRTNVQMLSHPIKVEEDIEIHSVVELDNKRLSSSANNFSSSEKNDSDGLLPKKKEYGLAETDETSDLSLRNREPISSSNFLNHVSFSLSSSPIVTDRPPLKTNDTLDIEFIDVNVSVDDCESIVEKIETVDKLKTSVRNTISFQPLKAFGNSVSLREPDDVHVLWPKKMKKSVQNDSSYRRNETRSSRLRSTPYVNYRNSGIEAILPVEEFCCQSKCIERINAENRAEIFTNFQELGDENSQDAYLQSLIQVVEYERKRPRKKLPASWMPHATHHKYRVNTSTGPQTVCLRAFSEIHCVPPERIRRLYKLLENGIYLGRMHLPTLEEEIVDTKDT